ncbi:MAG TPA: hypothetical protein VGQ26_11565 [Streptosporangiaceae bacterium]|jgi:hypothetical protein|nr:hypothetical protein [Streptosporangiaceae bacterium]
MVARLGFVPPASASCRRIGFVPPVWFRAAGPGFVIMSLVSI